MFTRIFLVAHDEIEVLVPKGLTITRYLTLIINFIAFLILLYPFHLTIIGEQTFRKIDLFFNSNILFFMFFIMIIFKFCYVVLMQIILKFGKESKEYDGYAISSKLENVYFFYLAIYFFMTVIKMKQSWYSFPKISFSFTFLLEVIAIIIIIILAIENLIEMVKIYLKKENWSKGTWQSKDEYLNLTMEKFKDKNVEEIEKRILLCQLYKETSDLYNEGIKFDETEFFEKE